MSGTNASAITGTPTLARLLGLGRPLVMGILNVTPDSFSDGGQFLDPRIAIDQAHGMIAEGADIVDIGAESIDTIKAEVAAWALDRGAAIVNDVWGLQRDPDMARVVAERGVPVVVMH